VQSTNADALLEFLKRVQKRGKYMGVAGDE